VELLCNIVVLPLFRSWKPCLHAARADDGIAVVTHLLRPRSLVLVFCDITNCATVTFCIFCFNRTNWNSSASLTEGFPCFFLICKANARVYLAKTGRGPHSSQLVNCLVLCTVCVDCVVICIVCVDCVVLCIVCASMCTVLLPSACQHNCS